MYAIRIGFTKRMPPTATVTARARREVTTNRDLPVVLYKGGVAHAMRVPLIVAL